MVRHAINRGQRVTAVTRQAAVTLQAAATRQAGLIALRGLGVDVVRIDDAFENLPVLASGHDLIVDAAAPHPLDPSMPGSAAWRETIRLAVRRTGRVLEAARVNQLKLAFVSSFTTLPRRELPLEAAESAWRRSLYPYFEAKLAMERAVLEAARTGLPVVIVNPAACLGPWEYRAEESSFVRLVLARRLPIVMDRTINVIDVRDVALAIELAVAKEHFGRPIPLAGHNVTVAELARCISALNGAGAAPITVDHRIASVAAFWTQAAFAAFGRPAPDLWRAVPLIADGFPMQPSVEQFAIDLPIRPLQDTLRDAVAFHDAVAIHDAVAFHNEMSIP